MTATADPAPDAGPVTAVPPRRPRRTARVAAVGVGVVVVLLLVLLATRDPATERATTSPLVGRAAPAIVGETVDGAAFDLDDLRGRWVVVNFFSTWCVPCRAEHPELVSFSRRHLQVDDARVVSVVFADEPEDVQGFFAAEGGEWPVVRDDDGRIALSYGVTGVPESFLVAPSGLVVQKINGGVTSVALDRLLASAQAAAAGSGP